ncbi:MAG: hypothetical protein OHK0052_08530 [Anaerolineales bacterium]
MRKLFHTLCLLCVLSLLTGCADWLTALPGIKPVQPPSPITPLPTWDGILEPGEQPYPTDPAPLGTPEYLLPTEPPPTPNPVHAADPANAQIFFYYNLPPSSPANNALNQIVDQFNRGNPYNILVDARNFADPGQIYSETLPLLGTTYMPAILMTDASMRTDPRYYHQLVDLDLFIRGPRWAVDTATQQDLVPSLMNLGFATITETRRLALPTGSDALGLYANLEWFNALGQPNLPATPEDFAALVCRAAKTPLPRTAQTNVTGYAFTTDLHTLAAWTFAFGGQLYSDDLGIYDFTQPAVLEATTFLNRLVRQGCAAARTPAQAQEDFLKGRTATFSAPISNIRQVQAANESGLAFFWEFNPLPASPSLYLFAPAPQLSIVSSVPLEQQAAAWYFLSYWVSTEAQNIWVSMTNHVPVRMSALDLLRNAPPGFKRSMQDLSLSHIEPQSTQPEVIEQQIEEMFTKVFNGLPPASALNALQEQSSPLRLYLIITPIPASVPPQP